MLTKLDYEYAGIPQDGATVYYEILNGEVEPVIGNEYVLTHGDTGRQFLVCGGIEAAMDLCSSVVHGRAVL